MYRVKDKKEEYKTTSTYTQENDTNFKRLFIDLPINFYCFQ